MATLIEKPGRETDTDVVALREEVRALTQAMRELYAQVDAQAKTIAELSARVAPTQVAPGPAHEPATEAEVSADTLLVIAAAVTAFLGKKVRIRSARRLQSPYEIVNPWSQQGRVFVQASHWLHRAG